MTPPSSLVRPVLAKSARYRFDKVRDQHQIVFPEGVLVLNEPGAAIVRLCDGRSTDDLIAQLQTHHTCGHVASDVHEFLARLARRGLVRDAADT